jgi:class 3 adenylate cyclase
MNNSRPPLHGSEGNTALPFLFQNPEGGLSGEQAARLRLVESDKAGFQAAILVTDDSEAARTVIVLLLRQLGYTNVVEAEDGEAALDLLRHQPFDLLLLDIEMPRLDGIGVLEVLKQDSFAGNLPVIVTSGLNEIETVVHCIELGAEDFLPKPVNIVLLRARISASIERKRLRDLERLRLIEQQRQHQLLEIEKGKTERLLMNILPRTIAERLRRGERTIAERYESVTVLFADLVDFTALTTRIDAVEVVSLLNDLFSRFDRLSGKFGLEKIKTIGDSYMVVGGLPEPRPDHSVAVASMALEMLGAMEDFNREHGLQLGLRVGLNTGPVVAGVIGRKKFTYDLWGYTVNVASRMQSSGLPNQINVPAGTYELLADKFRLTERGTVNCKGLGDIRTYVLEGKKN